METNSNVLQVNEVEFETQVLRATTPVVVDFWAEWCGPCKMLAPILDEVAGEQKNQAKFVKVNVDENPALANRYRIQSIPTLLYFSGGELKESTIGLTSKKVILGKLQQLVAASSGKPSLETNTRS